MFRETLEALRSHLPGTLAAGLIASDGIAVDLVDPYGSLPMDSLIAELCGFMRTIGTSTAELASGDVAEFSLVAGNYTVFFVSLTPEYYLLLVLEPGASYGKARFELKKASAALREQLQ